MSGNRRKGSANRLTSMTNTLHRYGDAQSFFDDYIVFATPSKGRNDEGCIPKLKAFLEMALLFDPVNMGDAAHGGALRPCSKLTPMSHWKRGTALDFRTVIDGIDEPATVAAVFNQRVKAEYFVEAVKKADLGLCVNISTSIDGAEQCCHTVGLCRHSVGYSLRFEGKTEKLPEADVLMLTTMCGHSMVSQALAGKMIDWVREGRRTPAEAAVYLARFCSCGVFNPSRAERALRQCARKSEE